MTPDRGSRAVTGSTGAVLLQWASESGAHGMPVPQELERLGWQRSAEHPLFRGTWLMEAAPSLAAAPVPSLGDPSEAAPPQLR